MKVIGSVDNVYRIHTTTATFDGSFVRTASTLKRMSWQDSSSKSDAGRERLVVDLENTASFCYHNLSSILGPETTRKVLTREDFAARREAAENAKKARTILVKLKASHVCFVSPCNPPRASKFNHR